MKLKDRLGKHPVLIITTICVICVAVIAGFTAHIELQRYEDGILDVCATQQDAYVQWMPRLTITGQFQRTSQCYL